MFKQAQNCRDESTGMPDADPKNEVDDGPSPVDGVVVAPHSDSSRNQICQAHSGEAGHAESRDKTPPPPSRGFPFDDATYFLSDPAETSVVENEGWFLPRSRVDLLENGRSFRIGSGGGAHVLVGVFLLLF